MSFFEELKRRNVVKVGIAYVLMGWVLLQGADFAFDLIDAPNWVIQAMTIVVILGLPIALFFAWAFELTPEGIKREHEVDRSQSIATRTGRKLDFAIIAFLVLVIALMSLERAFFAGSEKGSVPLASEEQSDAEAESDPNSFEIGSDPMQEQASVAVLPFRNMGSGADDGYFADGLTEELLNSLAALPQLLVTARTSSFFFKDKDLPIPEIAATLGVKHILEGSVRRAGDTVRITAQLVRASDGFHLWSDTFDRTLEDVFAVQEEIATSVATTLEVVLDEKQRSKMREAGIGDVEAFIAYQKGLALFTEAHQALVSNEKLEQANEQFDLAVSRVPGIPTALYLSTDLYGHILYRNATGAESAGETILSDAHRSIQDRLGRAIAVAQSPAQRAILEVEQIMLSEDWSGIGARLDRAFVPGDCSATNWMPSVAGPYGWARETAEHFRAMVRCDPLRGLSQAFLMLFETWNGRPEAAIQVAKQHERSGAMHPWVEDMKFNALLASGQYRNAPEAWGPNPEGSWYPYPRRVLTLARDGQLDAAREALSSWAAGADPDDMDKLLTAAALGDRPQANEAAARIDQRAGGTLVLADLVKGCLCGAPFELDVTPNFKARITEAGFNWPPPSPIQYPAKDW